MLFLSVSTWAIEVLNTWHKCVSSSVRFFHALSCSFPSLFQSIFFHPLPIKIPSYPHHSSLFLFVILPSPCKFYARVQKFKIVQLKVINWSWEIINGLEKWRRFSQFFLKRKIKGYSVVPAEREGQKQPTTTQQCFFSTNSLVV